MPPTPLQPLGDEILVNTVLAGNQLTPSIEPLAGGGYVIVWRTQDGVQPYTLHAQVFDANGNKVGGEILVEDDTRRSDFEVDALAGGGFAIIWHADAGNGDTVPEGGIKARLYTATGQPAGGEILVNSTTAGLQSEPRVTELSNGNFVVTWRGPDASLTGIKAQLFSSNGTPIGGEISVNDTTLHHQEDAQVVALPGGDFMIVWNDSSQTVSNYDEPIGQMDVRAQVFSAAGAKLGSEIVVNTATANKQELQELITLDNGNVVVVWEDYSLGAGPGPDIRAQILSPSGAKIGGEIVVADGSADQTVTAVSAVVGGFVIAVLDAGLIRLERFTADGTANGEAIIGAVIATDIVALADGRIAVTFNVHNFPNRDVYVQLFDTSLQPIGTPIPVHQISTADQAFADMALGADGRLMITWMGNDSDGRGIKAQLFDVGSSPGATEGDDTLIGTHATDNLQGLGGNDNLIALSSDDLLDGGTGIDRMEGGAGNDVYYVDNAGDVIVEAIGGGDDNAYTTVSYALGAGVEVEGLFAAAGTAAIDLTGNELDNILSGNAGNNTLRGGAGDDTIFGDAGQDVLYGDAGADVMSGGTGNDLYYVDDLGDETNEASGGGVDRVLSSISYVLRGSSGVNEIEILEAADVLSTERLDLTGSHSSNTIYGSQGVNVLTGGGSNDVLFGYGGDDFLIGGTSTDTLRGGLGDDTYYLYEGDQSDVIVELAGEGRDRVATLVSFTLMAGQSIEVLEALSSLSTDALNLIGNGFDNLIAGNQGVNLLRGNDGNDELVGYAGNDRLEGGNGNDILNGGLGNDVMAGGAGSDKYYVQEAGDVIIEPVAVGDDRLATSASYTLAEGVDIEILEPITFNSSQALDLTGNEFGNFILGNNGANIISGGGGVDRLEGLGGADSFLFNTAIGNGNIDSIDDFLPGTDRILLDNAIFTGLGDGVLAAGAFVTGTGAQDADDRIVYNNATGALFFDADGNGGGAAVQFATVTAGLTINASDFLVI